MQLKNILSLSSNEAVALAAHAANKRKAQGDKAYIMKCLNSKNMAEVIWARKQLGLDKPLQAAVPRLVKIDKAGKPYTKLRVEP